MTDAERQQRSRHKRRASAVQHQAAGTETTRGPSVWAALIETLDAQIARRMKEERV